MCIYTGVLGVDRSQLLMADNSEKEKSLHYALQAFPIFHFLVCVDKEAE